MENQLLQTFGNIDIYLFDQLLKGRYDDCRKIIDVGCGEGRNLHYFLQNGYEVWGIDQNEAAIAAVRELAAALAPSIPLKNFTVAAADKLPFEKDSFDLALSSAVLHFAINESHLGDMLHELFRVLKPGGYLFARLASDIGIENSVIPIGNGNYLLPDGSERFLVNEMLLLNYTEKYGTLYEPIKTTNVQNLRCMTTWCVQKR